MKLTNFCFFSFSFSLNYDLPVIFLLAVKSGLQIGFTEKNENMLKEGTTGKALANKIFSSERLFVGFCQAVTVNPEIFVRILFSRIALKDILATLKFCD